MLQARASSCCLHLIWNYEEETAQEKPGQISEIIRGKEESLENLGLTGLKNKTISNLQLPHSIRESQIKHSLREKSNQGHGY